MSDIELDKVQQFNNERDAALRSLDKETILAHYEKWGGSEIETLRSLSEKGFWGGMHRARVNIRSLTREEREFSLKWLQDNGFKGDHIED